jgi:hypothetical protein
MSRLDVEDAELRQMPDDKRIPLEERHRQIVEQLSTCRAKIEAADRVLRDQFGISEQHSVRSSGASDII